METDQDQQKRLADHLMGAHWGWIGNSPSKYLIPHRETAMVLAKLAIEFLERERQNSVRKAAIEG